MFTDVDQLPSELRREVTRQSLVAEQTLFQQGEPATALYVVETGRIRLTRYISEDKVATLASVGPGESLAEVALIQETYPCTAIAEVPSQVIAYPKQALLLALRQYPDLSENLMTLLVHKIQTLNVRLELRDIRASHDRVLRYLQYLAQLETTAVITIERPLKEIAAELGLTPETLSRALTRLENNGNITRSQQSITLHNSTAA